MLQNEDEKYSQIREKLRSLPKVKASDNFMVSLQHKINLIDAESRHLGSTIHKETHERIQQGAFARFFGFQQRPWLIPSLSFTVVIFLVLMVVYFGYFNTSGTNDTQTSNSSSQTITQNAQNGNVINNPNSNQQTNSNSNTGSTEEKTGVTDSQPGKDDLLATNDGRLGKTDSYNNKERSMMNKLPVMESGKMVETKTETPATLNAEETGTTSLNTTTNPNTINSSINSSVVGTMKDGGRIKSATKPFDENSGVLVDGVKSTSKRSKNVKEVNGLGKTDLESLIDALNDE